MNPQNNQQNLSPDDIAATLGHVTHLQEQMLPQPQEEASQEEVEAPQEAQVAPPDDPRFQQLSDALGQVVQNMEEMRKEMKDEVKRGIDGLKTQIQDVLAQ